MLHLFSVASSYGRRAVQFNGGILWNNLPSALQSPMSQDGFIHIAASGWISDLSLVTWDLVIGGQH